MSFTEKEVKKIAKLSRIRLTDEEIAHFTTELSGIFKWVEMLQDIDTKNVLPMASVPNMQLPSRDDVVNDGNIRDDILANAPQSAYGCFVVPKMVDQ